MITVLAVVGGMALISFGGLVVWFFACWAVELFYRLRQQRHDRRVIRETIEPDPKWERV